MKVCHLFPAVMLHDGPSNVLLALLTELASAGVDNLVVGLRPAPVLQEPGQAIARTHSKYTDLAMGPSILDVGVFPRLLEMLRKERPDILQCNLIRASLYGKLAARIVGNLPVIQVTHNVERYMTGTDATSRITRLFERRTRDWTAAQISVSNAVAHAQAQVLGRSDEAVQVIENGISPTSTVVSRRQVLELLHLPADSLVVGSVGRLHSQKNFPLLLRAFSLAAAHVRNLRLIIIGDGDERDNLYALARELGISDLVSWTGMRGDVEQLLGAIDIFAMTSDYEGLPVALLEAMRSGVPCVVTRAGGMPDAVIDGVTGRVVECRDLEGTSKALVALGASRALRIEMGLASRMRFQTRYSARRMASEYLHLYNRVGIHKLHEVS